ncbi:hypothetical protein TNCV_1916651 [Trichonephila clavipes]|uniref:Uncharacterized protein n=1 Tax=Trichonephila clavipes TaxID=2585209 RepID=A0A8X6W0P7_TRICX|nr:hypothetical protein TNCV_1916651 [Trichonephila clavipes]
MSPLQVHRQWFVVKGILYKGTLVGNLRCSRRRRIDKADISAPVSSRPMCCRLPGGSCTSFTAMRIRREALHNDVTFRCQLAVFRVVGCSLVHCFQTR